MRRRKGLESGGSCRLPYLQYNRDSSLPLVLETRPTYRTRNCKEGSLSLFRKQTPGESTETSQEEGSKCGSEALLAYRCRHLGTERGSVQNTRWEK